MSNSLLVNFSSLQVASLIPFSSELIAIALHQMLTHLLPAQQGPFLTDFKVPGVIATLFIFSIILFITILWI